MAGEVAFFCRVMYLLLRETFFLGNSDGRVGRARVAMMFVTYTILFESPVEFNDVSCRSEIRNGFQSRITSVRMYLY